MSSLGNGMTECEMVSTQPENTHNSVVLEHRAICLVVDRKYKANKKQICKGLSKVYTSNKKMQ